ncbi:hypothetical protein BdWA1_001031 [Babesia duncani]|uniref:Uncharacterized protein n=1 Tax=Babesia duncani TaxID=323732 RepID=A0AAD9UQG7_9APIC|nr:hypothetical protein BdWA1_001031 [Babesia duncani]
MGNDHTDHSMNYTFYTDPQLSTIFTANYSIVSINYNGVEYSFESNNFSIPKSDVPSQISVHSCIKNNVIVLLLFQFNTQKNEYGQTTYHNYFFKKQNDNKWKNVELTNAPTATGSTITKETDSSNGNATYYIYTGGSSTHIITGSQLSSELQQLKTDSSHSSSDDHTSSDSQNTYALEIKLKLKSSQDSSDSTVTYSTGSETVTSTGQNKLTKKDASKTNEQSSAQEIQSPSGIQNSEQVSTDPSSQKSHSTGGGSESPQTSSDSSQPEKQSGKSSLIGTATGIVISGFVAGGVLLFGIIKCMSN